MITKDTAFSILDNKQQHLLNQLLSTLNAEQKIWLGGYLTGIHKSTETLLNLLQSEKQPGAVFENSAPQAESSLKIMFGTRSGNSKTLAEKAKRQAINIGLVPEVVDLNDYDPKKIKKEQNVMIIISTDGEGDPPVAAEEFYNYLFSKKAPSLKNLQYSVLALGDKTYKHYCKTGKDIDKRLEELGATRFAERIDCDTDFEKDSSKWILDNLQKQKETLGPSANTPVIGQTPEIAIETGSKEAPYTSLLLDKVLLNGQGSTKKTWHMEFSIEDSGIRYSPGDSLGVISYNKPDFVELMLNELRLNGSETVSTYKGNLSLEEALTKHYEISKLTPQVVSEFAKSVKNKKITDLTGTPDKLENYCYGRDIIDIVKDFSLNPTSQELINSLRKLQPRLYSISSSYNYNPDEVHLTVGQVEYVHSKRLRKGVCSNYLSDIEEDNAVDIYIDENIGFRLPEDPGIPAIMIGAGTGIAPFRAFMQERSLADINTQNWLFFGDRNFTTDFLYQTEWQRYYKDGLLTKIDLAFSRDQNKKVYVQHKLLENGKEVYEWIRNGSNVYVCGDKNTLGKDVKKALIEIFRNEGDFSAGSAEDYFRQLRRDKQYQEDVY